MAIRPSAAPLRQPHFYRVAALLAIAVMVAGFAPSFYLKHWFHKPPALTLLLVVHGVVMTAWLVLFLVQAQLGSMRNLRMHRRLGVAGIVLAAAVFVAGTTVAITGAKLGHSPGPPPLQFLAIPLMDIVVFAILTGSALYFRRRTDIHKRLMLLAAVGILTAAVARTPLVGGNILLAFGTTLTIALGCVGWDTWTHRRLHPAFGWGFALLAVSWPLRLWLSGTAGWLAFARWLTGAG